ncbi:MAG TPA: response regulator [Pseudomonadota bacterium]|jgi:CheY-like chemotaxis protein|nr:response regulator [Pseudomonadota bacterium]
MPDAIRILSLGFASAELHMMQVVLDAAAKTLPRGFRLVKASETADVAVVNWSTLNIERTQAFLAERFAAAPLISVSETGVLGSPGVCVSETQLLPNLAAMVYEAIEGIEPAYRVRPPEYVSWLSVRRHDDARTPSMHAENRDPSTAKPVPSAPVFAPPPTIPPASGEPRWLDGLHLLLVDVRSDGADDAEQVLVSLGARVDIAIDEQDGWVKHLSRRWDAILIDARLADEAGFKLCRRITHEPVRKPPPVFMLADKLRPIERARAAHAGSVGFLTWPLKADALIAALGPLRISAAAG